MEFWQEINSDEECDHHQYFYKEEWGPGPTTRDEDMPAGYPEGSDWALIGGVATRYKLKKKQIKK